MVIVKFERLDDFWTEKDDSIKIDFSFDLLGVMVIWRLFAQEIFGYKITTVARNMKYYQINLFNLSTIWKVFQDEAIKNKVAKLYNGKDSKFRDDLIIFLENLLVWCFSEKNKKCSKDSKEFSVPGLSKFNKSGDEYKDKCIVHFGEEYDKFQILTRQIQLGISGRHKSPFREMKLDYDNVFIENSEWKEAFEKVRNSYGNYDDYVGKIINFLKGKELGCIKYDDVLGEICEHLCGFFSGSQQSDNEIKDFLLEKMGLTKGVARELFEVVKGNMSKTPREVFLEVLNKMKETDSFEGEEAKIENIVELEEFLAPIQHVFDALIETSNDDLSDYQKLENKITKIDIQIDNKVLKKVLEHSETARERLNKLKDVVKGEEKIKKLIEYHNEVQEERGSVSWIRLDSNNKIKRVRYKPLQTLDEWLKKAEEEKLFEKWKNDYYISSIKTVIQTM